MEETGRAAYVALLESICPVVSFTFRNLFTFSYLAKPSYSPLAAIEPHKHRIYNPLQFHWDLCLPRERGPIPTDFFGVGEDFPL